MSGGNLITKKDFDELRRFKNSFETALNSYNNAWKRINKKKVKCQIDKSAKPVALNVTHYDYIGFTKKELEFLNFLVMEKLRSNPSSEEKFHLQKLNKEIVSRIDSNPCCPNCGNTNVCRIGLRKNTLGLVQKFKCKNCKATFSFGRMNQDWQVLLTMIELHFAGYTSRKIGPEILRRHQKHIHWNTVCNFLKKLKPYLRPREMRLSEFDAWIKNCQKCKQPLQKKMLNFNFCPKCNAGILKAFKKLHEQLLEANLYAVP